MEDGFAWTGIAHGSRKHTQDDTIGWVVVLQQNFVTAHTYISRDIVPLGISYERVQEKAIHRFQGTFLNVFMCTVHGIARLKTNNTFPAALYKQLARLAGGVAILGKGLILQGNHTNRPTKQNIALLVHRFHAWMRF